jgi:2-succinyl-5-enolpyruvyl-6-hydroxy-3-cyclohexene-1-carboxylate synthase
VPAANAGQAFALVLADELARHGVTEAVLAPGSRSTPVALALDAEPRIRLHVRVDERSAAYLALGLARGSGRPVPVLCTSGTAAAHLHGAALEAEASRIPLLLLTADRPPELRAVGANQAIDQAAMFGTAVRWWCDVGVPESRADAVRYWRSLISHAVAVASGHSGGAAGPVHLNLPLREPLTPVDDGVGFAHPLDGRPDGRPWTASSPPVSVLPDGVVDRIAGARHGVVLAGDGLRPADADGVVEFATRHGWPLIAEPHSNARRGPTALRGADPLLRDADFVAAHAADLVVVAGRVGLSRAVATWLARHDAIIIDRDGRWTDPTRSAGEVVRGESAALGALELPALDQRWVGSWLAASGVAGAAIDAVLDGLPFLAEPRVARDVSDAAARGATLVVASSLPVRDLDLTMRPQPDLRVVANRGVSGIDGFVSTAVGVALASEGPAVALAGDLSLLHDANGLLADGPPDLTLVVVNNDGGGIFSLLPQAAGDGAAFERLFGTPHGVDLAQLASAYGVEHVRIDDPRALRDVVREAPRGLRIAEVRSDRARNAEVHRQLEDAAADALRRLSERDRRAER